MKFVLGSGLRSGMHFGRGIVGKEWRNYWILDLSSLHLLRQLN